MILRFSRELTMIFMKLVTTLCGIVLCVHPALAETEPSWVSVSFQGDALHESKDLSGVAKVGNYLVVGSDEGHVIQVLQNVGKDSYELIHKYSIPDGALVERIKKEKPERDIEGISASGNTVYIIGSHSRKRSKVERDNPEGRSKEENSKRLGGKKSNKKEKSRRVLYSMKLGDNGELVGQITTGSLWDYLSDHRPFKEFTKIPSKENGIDIEGIAVQGNSLFVGFRGPVLRENWVPILVVEKDEPYSVSEIRYVQLDGLGIRDMVAVNDDMFLLLGGPVGDVPKAYHLYSWDGVDCLPGTDSPKCSLKRIRTIATPDDAKAEGLTVLSSEPNGITDILVLYDGIAGGGPRRYTIQL